MNIEKENLEAIIQRYILDQLDERDAEDFEAYFLCRPEIADAVSTAQRLSVGLHAHQDAKAQKASSKEPVRNAEISFLGRLTQILSGPAPCRLTARWPLLFLELKVLNTPVTLCMCERLRWIMMYGEVNRSDFPVVHVML